MSKSHTFVCLCVCVCVSFENFDNKLLVGVEFIF